MRRRPACEQAFAAVGQQVAIGGHREVCDAERVQAGDVVFDAFANQRLTAGDADFADAERDEDAREPIEFRPGENLVVIAVVFRIGGTAVDAAKIAAVGDRDAQVGDLAAEFVVERHSLTSSVAFALLKSKSPNPYTWMRAQTKNYAFSSKPPFQAGGPGVSTRTLIPEAVQLRRPADRLGRHRLSLPQATEVGDPTSLRLVNMGCNPGRLVTG